MPNAYQAYHGIPNKTHRLRLGSSLPLPIFYLSTIFCSGPQSFACLIPAPSWLPEAAASAKYLQGLKKPEMPALLNWSAQASKRLATCLAPSKSAHLIRPPLHQATFPDLLPSYKASNYKVNSNQSKALEDVGALQMLCKPTPNSRLSILHHCHSQAYSDDHGISLKTAELACTDL